MAPHNDAPSPAGSYNAGFHPTTFRQAASAPLQVPSITRNGGYTDAQYSSSCSTSSLDADDEPRPERPLIPGVYVPTMCFFDPITEDVDTETIARHAVYLARAGVTGLTTQGSNGEAVHLTHSERQLVTRTTRRALDGAGYSHIPVIVGCGAQSVRETTQLCSEAFEAGGDYALVLPPSYYAGLLKPAAASVIEFFTSVADNSPIPLIIYNYPGGANGVDLSSDTIITLSQHPNIAGVKLTCGNTGKLNRVAAATRSSKATSNTSSSAPPFLVLAGSADFTLQALVAGGHGILAGLANIAPKSCLEVVKLYREGKMGEALKMQEIVARGDWTAIQGGVVSTKAGLQNWFGYGGYGRSPLPRPTAEENKKWKEGFRELVQTEMAL
ncbi:mitochondrial putative 4-hydroxy-2-oxoglutarate aldolase [Xylogone sp. PMI_703]|nr:mitochondrial putative 4-hydroxy-2-oxoglutarate aldolase [Xylogone sp. PMI_703]